MVDPPADQTPQKIDEPQAKIRECLTAFDESDRRVKSIKEAA